MKTSRAGEGVCLGIRKRVMVFVLWKGATKNTRQDAEAAKMVSNFDPIKLRMPHSISVFQRTANNMMKTKLTVKCAILDTD